MSPSGCECPNNVSRFSEILRVLFSLYMTSRYISLIIVCLFFRRTKFKSVVVLLQFSDKYPTSAIIVELKSKTLPPRLLAKMTELCDQEAKKFLGKPQVGR